MGWSSLAPLLNRGQAAEVHFVGQLQVTDQLGDDFRTNLALWRGLGQGIEVLPSRQDLSRVVDRWERSSVLVDALFGTGLTREIREPFAAAIEAANAAGPPIVSVDLPSGLDADEGRVLGAAIQAEVTVTFVAPKLGFSLADGPAHVGRCVVAEIGIPRGFLTELEAQHASSAGAPGE